MNMVLSWKRIRHAHTRTHVTYCDQEQVSVSAKIRWQKSSVAKLRIRAALMITAILFIRGHVAHMKV